MNTSQLSSLDSHLLRPVYTGDFLLQFQARFHCVFKTTGDSNRCGIASSLHKRFEITLEMAAKIAAEIAAKIASVNGPL